MTCEEKQLWAWVRGLFRHVALRWVDRELHYQSEAIESWKRRGDS